MHRKLFAAGLWALLVNTSLYAAPGDMVENWGIGGATITNSVAFGVDTQDRLAATVVDSSARVYQVGLAYNDDPLGTVVTRLNADGSTDLTYGNSGVARIWTPTHEYLPKAAALQADGKLLVGGWTFGPVSGRAVVCRLNSNGKLDVSFTGMQGDLPGCTTNVNTPWLPAGINEVESIVVQSTGKIVVIGRHDSLQGDYRLVATRLHTNGKRDTAFGDQALPAQFKGAVSFGAEHNMGMLPVDAVLASNDKITIAAEDNQDASKRDFYVIQLTSDGKLNPAFAGNPAGVRRIAFDEGGDNGDIPTSLSLTSTGGFVVAGVADVAGGNMVAVAKLTSSGALDPTFGIAGRVVFPFCDVCVISRAEDILVERDGRIVLGVQAWGGKSLMGVARLKANGLPDNTFGVAGTAQFSLFGSDLAVDHFPVSLAPHQGGILLGGWGEAAISEASDLFQIKFER